MGCRILRLKRMKSYGYQDSLGHAHSSDELVNYLSFALTGYLSPLNLPPCAMYLDLGLAGRSFILAIRPKLARTSLRWLASKVFRPKFFLSILHQLESLAVRFRFSQRFIVLDAQESLAILRPSGANGSSGLGGFSLRYSRHKAGQ